MHEIKDTDNVNATDKPDEHKNEGIKTNEVDKKLDANFKEYRENNKVNEFEYNELSGDDLKKNIDGREEKSKSNIENKNNELLDKVNATLGEKATTMISKNFGDSGNFEQLVTRIQNTDQPTKEIISDIRQYFDTMGYADAPENKVMLERLEAIEQGKIPSERVDIDFMQHELLEKSLVERGISKGYESVPGTKTVWDPAHDITRESLGVNNVYHPEALKYETQNEIEPSPASKPEKNNI